VARAEAYLPAKFHLDPSNRLATIRQHYRQTGHTDNGPIAQGEPFYKRSPKKLLSSNISSTCPHNMVNFGSLAAETEIGPVVWGAPANFNGFRVLAALLHGTVVVGISHTATLNRGRHLYSAGRPSRWALAHILVLCISGLPMTSCLPIVGQTKAMPVRHILKK